jgi:hypothetical protein
VKVNQATPSGGDDVPAVEGIEERVLRMARATDVRAGLNAERKVLYTNAFASGSPVTDLTASKPRTYVHIRKPAYQIRSAQAA